MTEKKGEKICISNYRSHFLWFRDVQHFLVFGILIDTVQIEKTKFSQPSNLSGITICPTAYRTSSHIPDPDFTYSISRFMDGLMHLHRPQFPLLRESNGKRLSAVRVSHGSRSHLWRGSSAAALPSITWGRGCCYSSFYISLKKERERRGDTCRQRKNQTVGERRKEGGHADRQTVSEKGDRRVESERKRENER